MTRPSRALQLIAAPALAALCRTAPVLAQAKPVTEHVQYLHVVGQDYAFEAPSTIPAGIVTFHLVNKGLDVHQMTIVELGVGHTLKDFFDAMHAKGQPPAWTIEVGMTPTIQPGAEAFLTVRLSPGRYLLSCLIPAKDGRSHVEKGMTSLLTVTAKGAAPK
ncbi:MAG: hypothetical protein HYX65_03785 [Gemmatimonadetes bacterium]|nr:hypothetical protein [Gemmatimonadota bacterium]